MGDYLSIIGTVAFATTSFMTPVKLQNEQTNNIIPYIYIQDELSEYRTDTIVQIVTNGEKKETQKVKLHLTKVSDYVPTYSSDDFFDVDYEEL